MAQPLIVRFTIVYTLIEDGWVMARVLEKPAAISQGRTREEARENVRDALREVLLLEAQPLDETDSHADRECLELTISP